MKDEYVQSSPFVRLFGNPGTVKILDVFLRRHYAEMSVTDIIGLADVSRSTFHRNVSDLEDLGVIEEAGQVGNTTQYRLNTESKLTKTLAQMHSDLHSHTEQILDETSRSRDDLLTDVIRETVESSEEENREIDAADRFAGQLVEESNS